MIPPEHILLTTRNPLTGAQSGRVGVQHSARYADLEEVVWEVRALREGGFSISPAISHLTQNGYQQWAASRPDGKPPHRLAFTLAEARQILAQWADADDRPFVMMRYWWQKAEVNPAALAAPYRVVEHAPTHYVALDNTPARHVAMLYPGTALALPTGSPVIGAAVRHSPSGDGSSFTGWVVEGDGGYTDPLPRKPDALAQLRLLADTVTARYDVRQQAP